MTNPASLSTARSIVDEVFGRGMTREFWSGNYERALPISVQNFDLAAVLPAVFFMFRFGYRRGKGKFLESFGADAATTRDRRRAATIERVARTLADTEWFEGFHDPTTQAILGDLLLCFCLENSKRALGRDKQVQRVAPAHYMASWLDLPESVVHLRYVPEVIVAVLANQEGDFVEENQGQERSWFAVGRGFEENVLLKAFHQGVTREGFAGGRTADRFQEEAEVGLDQLLMVRLAMQLGAAPDKLRGGEGERERISNQRPIAEQAAEDFSEDIRRFVRSYAGHMPRHAFVELLESCMAVGLTTILTSVVEVLLEWAETGEIPARSRCRPSSFFVDCSYGVERSLRSLAEQSADDFARRIERFPAVLMALRLLDQSARYDPKLNRLGIEKRPYATEWLNMLGDLLCTRRDEAGPILYELERKAEQLAERLEEDYPEATHMLRNRNLQPNPVWRMAEALTSLQGRDNSQTKLAKLVDSALLADRPNGLAVKRPTSWRVPGTTSVTRRELRSLAFTDSVLDYLVHLHVLRCGNKTGFRPLSFGEFLNIIHLRYGFCVDQEPEGMVISAEQLRMNRAILERRLRDLGLLVGVNDAEAMKLLRPRFRQHEVNSDDLD
jgi:hypothetical protein